MKAIISYLGRAVSLHPKELGALFHEVCTVHYVEQEEASIDNGMQARAVERSEAMYWYGPNGLNDGGELFFAYSGYGARIEHELRQRNIEFDIQDLVPCGLAAPRFDLLQGIQWRGTQMEVTATCMAVRHGSIDCPTGWGKSFLIGVLCRAYPDAVIVVTVPSVDVARDLHKRLQETLGGDVGFVGDSSRKPKRVTVAVTHSIHHCDANANLVIIDEVHAVLTLRFIRMLNRFSRAKFLGFTASPEGRSDRADGFLEAVTGPVVAQVPYQEAVDSGNVVPIRVWVYVITEGPNVATYTRQDLKNRYGVWRNPIRNGYIARAVREAIQFLGDPQVLIMVQTVDHAMVLQQLLPNFEVIHGTAEDERADELLKNGGMQEWQKLCTREDRARAKQRFSSGELKYAIATTVWSKGVDFKGLNVLVRADGLASGIQATQVPGRLSRLGHDGEKAFGLLIDFNDKFSHDLKARSASRFATYRHHGWPLEGRL